MCYFLWRFTHESGDKFAYKWHDSRLVSASPASTGEFLSIFGHCVIDVVIKFGLQKKSIQMCTLVPTFRFRLYSLCFSVHIGYYFTNGLHHQLQPFFPPFYSKITLQVKPSTTRTHYHVNWEKLHHLVATLITKFPLCKKLNLLNSLHFPCLEKLTAKFPVFPVPWPPWCNLYFMPSRWEQSTNQCILFGNLSEVY